MDSGERGMNPVAMTIINPRKEYKPSLWIEPATSCSSNQQPPVLKVCMLPIELLGGSARYYRTRNDTKNESRIRARGTYSSIILKNVICFVFQIFSISRSLWMFSQSKVVFHWNLKILENRQRMFLRMVGEYGPGFRSFLVLKPYLPTITKNILLGILKTLSKFDG